MNTLFSFLSDLVYWLNEMSTESRIWSGLMAVCLVAALWAIVWDRRGNHGD